MAEHPTLTNRSVVHLSFTAAASGDFENVPAPMYYICVEARDAKDSLERNSVDEPYNRLCLKILIQLPPRYVKSCPSPSPLSIDIKSGDPLNCGRKALQPHTKLAVGQHLKAWIYFEVCCSVLLQVCCKCVESVLRCVAMRCSVLQCVAVC